MDNRTIEEVRKNEDRLINKLEELENINNKLSSALTISELRIEKAIEYLKETTIDFGNDEMMFDKCNAYTLLEILKGISDSK